ncbi:MAG: hypothetical protein A2268_00655 [Candidatus Raymondbacteria bacterium RifOxyA12_full_50_37]|nr:MAG: hypothetical protein A2268_00655 [Candidatus Raymondbacteria bacterium RifOxyA12_full_50_37]OGJ96681.1 MAG: hypothetical protein A2350_01830 [Candidatus Raymondbacteria bacterium RifOxyB12_full_50_8]
MILVLVSVFSGYGKPLDLALGARPQGMGSAFIAIADDANASYWNPAAMALVSRLEFSVSNLLNQEFLGVNVNILNGIVPLPGLGTLGFSWQMVNAGLEEGDPDNELDFREDHWQEHVFSLSIARKLWDKLLVFRNTSMGITLDRYMYSTDFYDGAGLGFDLSVFTLLPYDIRFGLMARSLAAEMEGEMFDPEFRAGLGYELTIKEINRLVFASDIALKKNIEYANTPELEFRNMNFKVFEGVEYSFLKIKDFTPALRLGTNLTPLNDRGGIWAYACGGIGATYKNYRIDYAFIYNSKPELGLGTRHHVAISFFR